MTDAWKPIESALTGAQWEMAAEAYRSASCDGDDGFWLEIPEHARGYFRRHTRQFDAALRKRGLCIAPIPKETPHG